MTEHRTEAVTGPAQASKLRGRESHSGSPIEVGHRSWSADGEFERLRCMEKATAPPFADLLLTIRYVEGRLRVAPRLLEFDGPDRHRRSVGLEESEAPPDIAQAGEWQQSADLTLSSVPVGQGVASSTNSGVTRCMHTAPAAFGLSRQSDEALRALATTRRDVGIHRMQSPHTRPDCFGSSDLPAK